VPGPGSHNPEKIPKIKSPVYSMGSRYAAPKTFNSLVPGPGQYVNSAEKLKHSAPSFGFGSSKRPELGGSSKFKTPGPGSYKLPTKIGDTPEYAMPNRKPESKYV
jgi:hypothetical protein